MLSLPDFVDPLLPRPFAIVSHEEDRYQFIYRVVGKFTQSLTRLSVGHGVDIMGPLGFGFSDDFLKHRRVAAVAGGVGYASLLPLLERIKLLQGPTPLIYYGVRSDLEVIRRWPYVATMASDDGSVGIKNRVHQLLESNRSQWQDVDAFVVCGPSAMMKAVYSVIPADKSYYFLEEAMGCGFGICMACVVWSQEGDEPKKRVRTCLEGPVLKGDRLSVWAKGDY